VEWQKGESGNKDVKAAATF